MQNCLDAGVDMIIHCVFTEPDGTYRFRPDLVDAPGRGQGLGQPDALRDEGRASSDCREAREREGRLTADLDRAARRVARRALDQRVEAVRLMTQAGVRMTAGSDSPWGWYAPGEFVHEIHMLAQAGLSFSEAIVAGTERRRRIDRRGRGGGPAARRARRADVLVVRGDPTREITALWDVLDVYQAGRRIARGVR